MIKIDYTGIEENQIRPFSTRTSVSFTLSRDDKVKVELFSITGQLVEVAVNTVLKAGDHRIKIETSDISSGVYWLIISIPDTSISRKMTLLK